MVVEHAHGLRQRRGPNAKSSLHKAHLAPDAGLQAPGASLSFAQGSHDFESLDRGIGRGDRFETAHRLDQYLGVVCGKGRNPTLRLWPAIFSGEIDVFPGDRRSRLISSMTSVAPA
ncbi:hypothetical protein AI2858V1_4869 (plasmid) [Escherichia coli]|nr:hypothetical protein AI2858V1_4869 [Escherichia coli]CAH5565874.1 hypothetical protein AI2858V1_4869 [Escherichia coli]